MKEYAIYTDGDYGDCSIMIKDYGGPVLKHTGIKCKDLKTAEKVVRGLEWVAAKDEDEDFGY